MYGGVRWEYCLEEWGAKSYFWGVLSKGVRRDIIGVSIELLMNMGLIGGPGAGMGIGMGVALGAGMGMGMGGGP